jgi:hypothetical protein
MTSKHADHSFVFPVALDRGVGPAQAKSGESTLLVNRVVTRAGNTVHAPGSCRVVTLRGSSSVFADHIDRIPA